MSRELKILAAFVIIFLVAYFLPLATPEFAADTDPVNANVTAAIVEAFVLLQWYAQSHLSVRRSRSFHCGGDHHFSKQRSRAETPRSQGQQSRGVLGGVRFWHRIGCVLV